MAIFYTIIIVLLQILRIRNLRILTDVPFQSVFIFQIRTIGFFSEESAIIIQRNPALHLFCFY